MYRHLLVPIDDTDLSTLTTGRAVEFARSIGARITFFHALPDHASELHGETEVLRLAAPEEFRHAVEGRTHELLTKAEAASRAQGVPCSSLATDSDAPWKAILAAARAQGCDLVFMASHGRRNALGMMLGSQTLKVLTHSEIPVLVSAMADPPAPAQAVAIIREEHRSLAAVIHAWLHMLKMAESLGEKPDVPLMRAMLHYLEAFPQRLHHPKEHQYLFERLRERTSSMNADLDELERQHERDAQLIARLATLIDVFEAGSLPVGELAQAVSHYATFIWEHMGREEGVLLPAAQRYLTEQDWEEIAAAFRENHDPRFGEDTDDQYRRLFARIAGLAREATK